MYISCEAVRAKYHLLDTCKLQSVLQSSAVVKDYKFDTKKEEWCEVTLQVYILKHE